MGFVLKIHETKEGKIAAVCDSGLIGKKFVEREVVLEVTDFFRGESATIEEIVMAIKSCMSANIIGTAIVDELVKEGIVDEKNVLEIKGVKHAQIFRV